MPMKRRVERIVCCLTLLIVGYSLRELCDWTYFSLDKDVSIIDALSIFLTLGGTFYITRTIEKEREITRIEKDIFIAHLNAIEASLLTMEERVSRESKYIEITRVYTDSKNNSIKFFNRIKEHMPECSSNNQMQLYEDKIMNSLRELKPLLTKTPDPNISLSQGTIKYTLSQQVRVRELLNATIDNLFSIKMLVNRL